MTVRGLRQNNEAMLCRVVVLTSFDEVTTKFDEIAAKMLRR